MEGILKPSRDATGNKTTLEVEREVHRLVVDMAGREKVAIKSLTKFLILSGIDRIEREGLPLAISA